MSEQVIDRATLEKKDKGELTTIVNALGGKATSRMKKSDLVDLIIERSGAVVAESDGAASGGTLFGAEAESGNTNAGDSNTGDSSSDDADSGSSESGSGRAARNGGATRSEGSSRSRSEGTTRADASSTGARGQRSPRQGSNQNEGRNQNGERGQNADRSPSADGQSGDADAKQGDRQRKPQGSNAQGSNAQGGNSQGSRGKQGGNNQPENQQGTDQGNSSQGNSSQGKSTKQAGNNQPENQQGGNQQAKADDVEGGNRRRRRRGRGRDRDDMVEPVTNEPLDVAGILDLRDDGYGFIRVDGLLPSKDDVYVPVKLVRQHGLRRGDLVAGTARPANRNEKNPALAEVDSINGRPADDAADRVEFEKLTPVFPDSALRLERTDEPESITPRLLDLIAPIGQGQRALIVAPPGSGKTTLVKELARSIELNHPESELVVLLIDERPEDVTDMRRHLEHGDVIASTFERPADEHCAVAELTLERAKRMVEAGSDVVIILDGISSLARAYNIAGPATGRTLAGGIDAGAIYPTKHFFGSARNIEEGGSLTVIATAAIETGFEMDASILGEFEGTANTQIRLDRLIAERGIFPAFDIGATGTRNDDLLFGESELPLIGRLRSMLDGLLGGPSGSSANAAETLRDRLTAAATNQEFLNEIA